MMEAALAGGLVVSLAAGLVGYGRLQGRVASVDEKFNLLRDDLKRLADKLDRLTELLLEDVHGEDFN